jgi:hypothetical protein
MSADKDKIKNRVTAVLECVCMVTTAFAFMASLVALTLRVFEPGEKE